MKLSGIVAVTCFGVLILPLRSGQAQDERPQWHKLADLTNQWRKDAVNGQDVEARRRAVDGFTAIGREMNYAVTSLSNRLTDQDDEVRVKAAKALVTFGPNGRGAAPNLCHVLETDPLYEARLHAGNALGAIFSQGSNPSYVKSVIPVLIKASKHDRDPLVRRSACAALGNIGQNAHAAAPLFLEMMKDKEDASKQALARECFNLVVSLRCRKLVPTLLEMHKNGIEDPLVEGSVLIALGKIGEKEDAVLPILVQALKNPKRLHLRGAAALAIGKMGPKAEIAVPDLIRALDVSMIGETRLQVSVQLTVLEAIADIEADARSAIPALRNLATDNNVDRGVRKKAEQVLKSLEEQ